jgi:hypothetical protein
MNFKVQNSLFLVHHSFVRMIGVEPTWIAPPDPKSGASASFATSAKWGAKVRHFSKNRKQNCLRKFVYNIWKQR